MNGEGFSAVRFATLFGGLLLLAMLVLGAASIIESGLGARQASPETLTVFLNCVNRSLGVVLAVAITLCAIAIPLTANAYTPKLIDLFISDRVNMAVLGYFILAIIYSTWALRTPEGTAVQRFHCWMLLGVVTGAFLMALPYAYYVFAFLLPKNIVARVRREILRSLAGASRLPSERAAREKERIANDVEYLADIALRSVDRFDREIAFESLESLLQVHSAFLEQKPRLSEEWFRVTATDFPGFATETRRAIERTATFYEVHLLEQVAGILEAALGRLPEGYSLIAYAPRKVGVEAAKRDDQHALDTAFLYLNTFMRRALSHGERGALYTFFYHYRRLAEELLEPAPAAAGRAAFFISYYGHQAAKSGMPYVLNTVAHDLGEIVHSAALQKSPAYRALLVNHLELDHDQPALVDLPGIVKSYVILAARLRELDRGADVALIVEELAKSDREVVELAFDQIEGLEEREFWELTDRRRHMDYLEERLRRHLAPLRQQVLEALG